MSVDSIARMKAMLNYQDCVDMVDLRREDFLKMHEGATLPEVLAVQEQYCRLRTGQGKDAQGATPQDGRREAEAAAKRK
jgi:hypothetical protein